MLEREKEDEKKTFKGKCESNESSNIHKEIARIFDIRIDKIFVVQQKLF